MYLKVLFYYSCSFFSSIGFSMKFSKIKVLSHLAFLFFFLVAICSYAQPFYVDPINGRDTYNGSLATPFQTITKARDAVRLVNSSMTKDIYVYLFGGDHRLTSTLNFTSADGGTNNFKVIYQAYNNQKPVISGGKKVTGWSLVAGQKYYVANVPTGTNGFPSYCRNIWVNGRRCLQAKSDFINVYPKPFDDVATTQICDGYVVKKAAIKNYTNLSDIRIFHEGIFKHIEQSATSINNISDSEQVIMMKQTAYDTWAQSYLYNNLNQIQVWNAFEELDEPGEFYLNRTTRKLYYYPRPGENLLTADVEVPAVETLVKLTGTSANRLQNLQFEGIGFDFGNWSGPLNTTKEVGRSQADLYSDYTSIEGQFWMDFSQLITIKKCRFEHLTSGGIYLLSNNNNILIEGNIFHDLTTSSITIGRSMGATLNGNINRDIIIRNNLVRQIGEDFFQASGIFANASKNVSILHNDVADVAYFGINQRYGNSAAEITSTGAVNNTGNTLIQYNRVSNYGTAFKYGFGIGDEIAGIYFFGVRNSKVQHNYVRHGGKDEALEGAYRQDQYGFNNLWDNNVSECNPIKRSFSWHTNQAGPIMFSNCYANVLGEFLPTANADTNNFFYEPTAPAWSTAAQTIINNAGLEPAYQYLLNELGDGSNIAPQATVTSSSNFGAAYSPSNINDGDAATAWKPAAGNESTGSWVQLAFPNPIRIEKLQLVTEYNNFNPEIRRYFEVWLSNDANFTSYKVLGGQSQKPFPYYQSYHNASMPVAYNSFDIYGNDSLGFQYIRIVGRSISLAECRVYGSNQPVKPTTYPNNSQLVFSPFTAYPPTLENETWSQKVEDTIDHARVYFGSNVKYWSELFDAIVTVSGGIATISNGTGTGVFRGAIFRNEAINLKMKITENGTGFQRIVFRAPCFSKGLSQQENYHLRIQKIVSGSFNTNIQLFRSNKNGVRSTLFGIGGSFGGALLKTTTLYSDYTPVNILTRPNGGGLQIVVKIGTDTIINLVDFSTDRVTQPGYLLLNAGVTNGFIEITDIPVTGIQLKPLDTTISVNQTIQLMPVVLPENATIGRVIYSSTNPSIATVNSVGQVTGIAVGQTTIKATTQDGGFVASILVKVQVPLSLEKISVNAVHLDRAVNIYWNIVGGKDLNGFEVQQSCGGENYVSIGFVSATQESSKTYYFKQNAIEYGSCKFRIKVIHINGSISYSNEARVVIPDLKASISLLPNPIKNNQFHLAFNTVKVGKYQLKVINNLGQLLHQETIVHPSLSVSHSIRLPSTCKGSKVLFIIVTPEKASQAIFKQKVLVAE